MTFASGWFEHVAVAFRAGIVVAAVLVIGISASAQATSQRCLPSWRIVASAPRAASIVGVAAISTSDVWLVGDRIERWNGASWQLYGRVPGTLRAVTAVSATDVWAVGKGQHEQPLIMHWDGHTWHSVASAAGASAGRLEAIGAASSRNVWAAGSAQSQMLVEHWNGDRWRRMPMRIKGSDRGGFSDLFHGLALTSTGTPWFVGEQTAGQATWSLVRRGTSRRRSTDYLFNDLKIQDCGDMRNDDALWGIAAVPAQDDLWAVGWNQCEPLIEHWNGHRWRHVGTPSTGILYAATAFAANDIWAVGDFIVHFDGHRWHKVMERRNATFTAISGTSSNDVWAVGGFAARDLISTHGRLIAHYSCT